MLSHTNRYVSVDFGTVAQPALGLRSVSSGAFPKVRSHDAIIATPIQHVLIARNWIVEWARQEGRPDRDIDGTICFSPRV